MDGEREEIHALLIETAFIVASGYWPPQFK